MADRTVQINSFKYGLDTRREALASLPGTLQTAQNVVIDSGGEIDKRFAFVPVDSAHITLPAGCFGLQDTDSGLMTFGSATTPSGLPTGVVYQQLVNPYFAADPMIAVLFSCSFLGKAFVIAQYTTNNIVLVFYNGALVTQITDGTVKGSILSVMATDLAAMVNRITGWLADANVTALPYNGVANNQDWHSNGGYLETGLTGSVLIMSPPGVHFTPVIENNNSISGVLGTKIIDQNYPGIGAIAASAAFQFTAVAAGTVTMTAPAKADGSGTAALTGGAVATGTVSVGQTVVDMVNAINNNTFLTGYSASGSVDTVTVYAPTSFGNVTFNLHVVTSVAGITGGPGTPGQKFTLVVTPANITPANQVPPPSAGTFQVVGGYLTASVSGKSATGTITYKWQECNSDGSTPVVVSSGITINPTAGPSIAVGWHTSGTGQIFQGFVLCTATDNGVPTATASRVISVRCIGPTK